MLLSLSPFPQISTVLKNKMDQNFYKLNKMTSGVLDRSTWHFIEAFIPALSKLLHIPDEVFHVDNLHKV